MRFLLEDYNYKFIKSNNIENDLKSFFNLHNKPMIGPAWILQDGNLIYLCDDDQYSIKLQWELDPSEEDYKHYLGEHGDEVEFLLKIGYNRSDIDNYLNKCIQLNNFRVGEEHVARLANTEPNSMQYKTLYTWIDYTFKDGGFVSIAVNKQFKTYGYRNSKYIEYNDLDNLDNLYADTRYVIDKIHEYYRTGKLLS